MRRIVLIGESARNRETVKWLCILFPECRIEVASRLESGDIFSAFDEMDSQQQEAREKSGSHAKLATS